MGKEGMGKVITSNSPTFNNHTLVSKIHILSKCNNTHNNITKITTIREVEEDIEVEAHTNKIKVEEE